MTTTWLLITGGSLLDGTGTPAIGASVLVRGTRIVAVGSEATRELVPRGEVLTEIDARHKTVMPGLIDVHCHMTYGESRTEEEIDLYTSPELRTLKAAWNAQKVLSAGVTSISQPGGSYYIGVALREAINAGIVLGPRMTSAGRYISTSNSLTDWFPDSVGVPEGSIGVLANSTAEIVSEIRHQVKNGVDFIKLADSPEGDYQAFTNDELKIAAELAHQLRKQITLHARGDAEVGAAISAGFDWIMHGNVMSEETIGRLADSRIPLVPTLLLLANVADWGHLCGVPTPLRDSMKRMLDRSAETLHRAHDAGVRFALGTDSGFSVTMYGEWPARELELLTTYAGLSPLEAIQAGTQHGAPMLSMEHEVGVLAPGMLADMIVVDGDPSKDIRILQDRTRIVTVIKDGQVVEFDEAALRRRWPHNRGLTYSQADLTYEAVYGDDLIDLTRDVGSSVVDAERDHELMRDLRHVVESTQVD
jgi:imidazolonepropionase-like amidohydrolase